MWFVFFTGFLFECLQAIIYGLARDCALFVSIIFFLFQDIFFIVFIPFLRTTSVAPVVDPTCFPSAEQDKAIDVSLLVSLQARLSQKSPSRLKLFLCGSAKIWLSSKRNPPRRPNVVGGGRESASHAIGWKYYLQGLHKSEIRSRPSGCTTLTDPQSRLP